MDLLHDFIDFFLHIDDHLVDVIRAYGFGTYAILFVVIFCETGLVFTPFLPGDSLLFAAGALAAAEGGVTLNVVALFVLLAAAAVIGDTVNYFVGKFVGERIFELRLPFVRREYLDRTHQFYEKHGGKTIIIARFVPIVRTFAPFVAGLGAMNYAKFITYNIIGGVGWVAIFVFGGFLFGNIPFIRENFSFVTIAIILISVLPIAVEFARARRPGAEGAAGSHHHLSG
jgi:membrane-associated protein